MHLEKTKGFSSPSPPPRPKRNKKCRLPKAVQSTAHVSQPNKDRLPIWWVKRASFKPQHFCHSSAGFLFQQALLCTRKVDSYALHKQIKHTASRYLPTEQMCFIRFSVESEKRRTGKNSEPLPPQAVLKVKRHYIWVTHCQGLHRKHCIQGVAIEVSITLENVTNSYHLCLWNTTPNSWLPPIPSMGGIGNRWHH